MKILVLTHTINPRTGMGVFTNGVINGLKKIAPNIEILVLTSDDYLKPGIKQLVKNWSILRSKFRESDIVHAIDGYPYGAIASILNLGISKPLVLTAVGTGSVSQLGGFGRESFLLRLAYRKASVVTAISTYIAKEIQKVLPNLSVEVVNPCVDYEFYSNVNKKELGKYIVTQGEFKKRKGYEKILPIMKEIFAKQPNLRYTIVGNTNINKDYFNELLKLMEKLGIRDRIDVKSNLTDEELRNTYADASLYFTLPINDCGDVEGFGMAIVEAAATGTPAIVGKGSGADDTVRDGESGFLVHGENQQEVIEKVLSIIDDKKLRERLSIGAQNLAKENSPENKAKKYIEIYEKLK